MTAQVLTENGRFDRLPFLHSESFHNRERNPDDRIAEQYISLHGIFRVQLLER